MKTIKQLADYLGVSKTAVRKYMTEDFRQKYTETTDGNIIVINEDGCRVIAESIKKPQETTATQNPESPESPVSGDMVALLQTTIETLREQLAAKDKQIAALTEAVKAQAQSINADRHNELAGTMQQMLPEHTEPPRKKRRWTWSKKEE